MGKVLRPHGTSGLLRIWSYASSEASFLAAGSVYLKSASGQIEKFAITSLKAHKNIFLLQLRGLSKRDEAEAYRDAEIFVMKEALIREEDEYFWHDIIGLEVYLDSGEFLGRVSDIIPTGSNDIYVVTGGSSEILIPATYDVVNEIDLENGKMIITAMEGLLDLNAV